MNVQYTFRDSDDPLTLILSPSVGERRPRCDVPRRRKFPASKCVCKVSQAVALRAARLPLRTSSIRPSNCAWKVAQGFIARAVRLLLRRSSIQASNSAWKIPQRSVVRVARFLSLSQRERIKVRDSRRVARVMPSKSSPELHPDFRARRYCRILTPEFLHVPGNDHGVDRVPAWPSKCARHRQARWLVAVLRNRNRGCNRRWDAAGEICTRQTVDSEGDAREYVRTKWHSFGGNARESLRGNAGRGTQSVRSEPLLQQRFLPPHLNPLPRFGGEVDARGSLRLIVRYGL